jgi:hypothetical protein
VVPVTHLRGADHAPARWEAISRSNHWIRRIRSFLREGDINQLRRFVRRRHRGIRSGPGARWFRARHQPRHAEQRFGHRLRGILYPGKHGSALDLAPTTVSVTVEVPADFGDHRNVRGHWSGTSVLAYSTSVSGRQITISGIPLDNSTPARVLVFAADAQVRAEMDSF